MGSRVRSVWLLLACSCGLWLMAAPLAAAEGIAVIVSKASPSPQLDDAGTLRDIYLKKIFVDGSGRKFIPVNLPVAHPLRQAVSSILFRVDAAELQDYWNQRYFHGVTPPYVLGSQDAVVRFVARTPGAIGYVAPCFVDASVRQIMSLSLDPAAGVDLRAQCPPQSGPSATGSP